jgi:bacillolysin
VRRTILVMASLASVVWTSSGRVASQTNQTHPIAVAATRSDATLRAVDAQIDQMVRSRDLRVREVMRDADLPDRRHERFEQYYRGVRIAGGDMTRQSAPDGTVSIFGMLHTGLDLDTAPRLSVDAARAAIAKAVDGQARGDAELVVLPLSDGYHLAYAGQAFDDLQLWNVYVDAASGAVLRKFSDFRDEVGRGKGTYGDDKKVATKAISGTFVTDDPLRPSAITTYDMKGNLARTTSVLNRFGGLSTSDMASDSDNDWTDPTVVDGHVYAGWYYDYLFKRFNRHGIDDRELRIWVLTHPVTRSDISRQPNSVVSLYYLNAFFCPTCGPDGRGTVLFGEGAPLGFVGPGIEVQPFSAALDVVAHELTHAVTAATSNLNSFPFSEGGALNEAFSDMFGNSTAFFYERPGPGNLQADYVIGKDLTTPPGGFSIRNMSNPGALGDPDHFSRRIIGGDPHFNSTIASHAFYLAIEGGTNRTSGQFVQGVGANNRDQIEKAFFRALTVLMTSNSTFALTRTATIQAARDLFGTASAAERAITQAWSAVGVQDRTVPTAAAGVLSQAGSCSTPQLTLPNWLVGLTASAGASTVRVTSWSVDLFDADGSPLSLDMVDGGAGRLMTSGSANNANQFAQSFNFCGPGSSTIVAQSDACGLMCVSLGSRASGSVQFTYSGTDAAGRVVTATTGFVPLR